MMKMKALHWDNKAVRNGLYILRGAAVGLAFSTIAVLIFALIVKATMMADGVIPVVNMILKIISIFLAVIFAVAPIGEKGWLYGAITGLVYILLSFLLFSALEGGLQLGGALGWDLLTGAAAGGVSGMICMYLQK